MPSSLSHRDIPGSLSNSVYPSNTFSPVPASTPIQVNSARIERDINSNRLPIMDTLEEEPEPEVSSDKDLVDEQEPTPIQTQIKSFGSVEITGRGAEMRGIICS